MQGRGNDTRAVILAAVIGIIISPDYSIKTLPNKQDTKLIGTTFLKDTETGIAPARTEGKEGKMIKIPMLTRTSGIIHSF